MSIATRRASTNDSVMIALLADQLGYKTSAEKMEKRLYHVLSHTDHCVYVSLSGEAITGWIHGFCTATVESDPCVEIGGLVIDEDHRRKGIGQLLVNEVIAWAKSKQVNKVRVRSNVIRKDTHLFYTGIGFTEVKEQKVFDILLN